MLNQTSVLPVSTSHTSGQTLLIYFTTRSHDPFHRVFQAAPKQTMMESVGLPQMRQSTYNLVLSAMFSDLWSCQPPSLTSEMLACPHCCSLTLLFYLCLETGYTQLQPSPGLDSVMHSEQGREPSCLQESFLGWRQWRW